MEQQKVVVMEPEPPPSPEPDGPPAPHDDASTTHSDSSSARMKAPRVNGTSCIDAASSFTKSQGPVCHGQRDDTRAASIS